ncbi:MAG: hypothetical protein QM581_02310 [Pseudomonas sp.]
MSRPAVLFATARKPDRAEPLAAEQGNIVGLAEWLDTLPDLFLLLIGPDGERLPFSALDDSPAQAVLAAPSAPALARLRAFAAWAEPRLPQAEARTELARMVAALQACPLPWLLLDTVEQLAAQGFDSDLAAGLEPQHQRASALASALSAVTAAHRRDTETPAILLPLLQDWRRQWGWWSPVTVARTQALGCAPQEDQALFEREGVRLDKTSWWAEGPSAYVVHPAAKAAGSRPPATGLLAPHGRWLLGFDAGVEHVQWNSWTPRLLVCHRDGPPRQDATPTEQTALLDVNGLWIHPFGSFSDILVISYALALVRSDAAQPYSLIRIEDGQVLHQDLAGAYIDDVDGGDGLLRLTDTQGRQTVADPHDARLLLPFRYARVRDVHARKRWAVVADEQGREGIAHLDKGELIACRHEFFVRGNTDQPPRVYRRDRWAAADFDPRPRLTLYATDGRHVAGPVPFPGWITPLLTRGDLVLVYEYGDGPRSPVAWMDFDGNIVERTGRTWEEVHEEELQRSGVLSRASPKANSGKHSG